MAYRAILGGRNVGWVGLGIFAGRRNTIVAGRAIIDNTLMIEHRRCKGAAGYMTDVAILVCCYMRGIGPGILTDCINTIVAGITPLTHNFGSVVVYKRIEEVSRVMTHRTITACVAMNYRIRSPSGPNSNIIRSAIMARGTIIGDTRVSEY